jgi:hypothetical protein
MVNLKNHVHLHSKWVPIKNFDLNISWKKSQTAFSDTITILVVSHSKTANEAQNNLLKYICTRCRARNTFDEVPTPMSF